MNVHFFPYIFFILYYISILYFSHLLIFLEKMVHFYCTFLLIYFNRFNSKCPIYRIFEQWKYRRINCKGLRNHNNIIIEVIIDNASNLHISFCFSILYTIYSPKRIPIINEAISNKKKLLPIIPVYV